VKRRFLPGLKAEVSTPRSWWQCPALVRASPGPACL